MNLIKQLGQKRLASLLLVVFMLISLLALPLQTVKAEEVDARLEFLDKVTAQLEQQPTAGGVDLNFALDGQNLPSLNPALSKVLTDLNLHLRYGLNLKEGTDSHLFLEAQLSKKSEPEVSLSGKAYNVAQDYYIELPSLLDKALYISGEKLASGLGAGSNSYAPLNLDMLKEQVAVGKASILVAKDVISLFKKHAGEPQLGELEVELREMSEKLQCRTEIIPAEKMPAFLADLLEYAKTNENFLKVVESAKQQAAVQMGGSYDIAEFKAEIEKLQQESKDNSTDQQTTFILKTLQREDGSLAGIILDLGDERPEINTLIEIYQIKSGADTGLKLQVETEGELNLAAEAVYQLNDKAEATGDFKLTTAEGEVLAGTYTDLGLTGEANHKFMSGKIDLVATVRRVDWQEVPGTQDSSSPNDASSQATAETTETAEATAQLSSSEAVPSAADPAATTSAAEPTPEYTMVAVVEQFSLVITGEVKEGRNFFTVDLAALPKEAENNAATLLKMQYKLDFAYLTAEELEQKPTAPTEFIDTTDAETMNKIMSDPEFNQKLLEIVGRLGLGVFLGQP